MKTLNRFIVERLKLSKDTKVFQYNYHPKDFDELRSLVEQLLEERGKDANLNDIDVSEITTFYEENKDLGLFENLDPHNIKIDKWDVSEVENMCNMFFYCVNFTGKGLENWKPIKCENMSNMFQECRKFNCNLSNWDVRIVKTMYSMFDGCTNFTGQGLENWKPIKCENMDYMFDNCPSLKNTPSWYK